MKPTHLVSLASQAGIKFAPPIIGSTRLEASVEPMHLDAFAEELLRVVGMVGETQLNANRSKGEGKHLVAGIEHMLMLIAGITNQDAVPDPGTTPDREELAATDWELTAKLDLALAKARTFLAKGDAARLHDFIQYVRGDQPANPS